MYLNTLKDTLVKMIRAKTPVVPMLWGPHGIGKTQIVRQAAKELGYKLITVTLSQKEAVDIAGLLYTAHDTDLGIDVTAYHPPKELATAMLQGNCVIFFDEVNRARKDVQNTIFPILQERELN